MYTLYVQIEVNYEDKENALLPLAILDRVCCSVMVAFSVEEEEKEKKSVIRIDTSNKTFYMLIKSNHIHPTPHPYPIPPLEWLII